MRFLVTIERDEDGVWVVECPSIQGCVSQGSTKDRALSNVRESILLCLEARATERMPSHDEVPDSAVAGESIIVAIEQPADFPDPIWWDREERTSRFSDRLGH